MSQTELTEDEYESFREIAAERGMTVKEAGHEALVRGLNGNDTQIPRIGLLPFWMNSIRYLSRRQQRRTLGRNRTS